MNSPGEAPGGSRKVGHRERENARVRFCIIEQKCGHEVGCPPRLV